MTHEVLPPGSTIGILGGGQLGASPPSPRRGWAIACIALMRRRTIRSRADVAAGHVERRLRRRGRPGPLRRPVDVITYEFENVPEATVTAARRRSRCAPSSPIHFAQHRLREKEFFARPGSAPRLPADRERGDVAAATAAPRHPQDLHRGLRRQGPGPVATRADSTRRGDGSAGATASSRRWSTSAARSRHRGARPRRRDALLSDRAERPSRRHPAHDDRAVGPAGRRPGEDKRSGVRSPTASVWSGWSR